MRRRTAGALFVSAVLAASSAHAQTKPAKPDPNAELKAQLETLQKELAKTQETLTQEKVAQEQDRAKIVELEAQVAVLQAQLLAAQDQLATSEPAVDEEARQALQEAQAQNAELNKRIEVLERAAGRQGLIFFGYLAANARFIDLPDIENPDGTIADKRQDIDFFNNVVELDFERSYQGRAKVRADLLFNFNPGNAQAGFQGRAFQIDTEQAYAEINWPEGGAVAPPVWTNPNTAPSGKYSLLFGRVDAPWGFEPVNAPGNYTASRSNLFQLIKPKLFTGALGVANWTPQISTSLYVVNGLEDNFDVKNLVKTVGGRIDLSALPQERNVRPWSIALNFLAGSEQLTANDTDEDGDNLIQKFFPDPTVLGDLEYRLTLGKLLIGGDALFGTIFDAQGGIEFNQGSNPFFGLNATLHYDINDRLGYTFRYDTMIDPEGALAGANVGAVPLYPGRNQNTPADANVGGTLHSVTAALNFTLIPRTPTLTFFEYRLDRFVPEDTNVDTKSAQTLTIQFIYSY